MAVRHADVFAPGRVACITGSSSGIGREVARRCAKFGMKVFMADVDEAMLKEAAEEVGKLAAAPGDVVGVVTNVADAASVEKLKDTVFAAYGACHFLHNNAGIGRGGGALAPLADWERTLGVNMWGVIHGCQAFVPAMKATGAPGLVVNTGSKQGITAPPGNLAYNVSKTAVKVFTEGLQHEFRSEEGCKLTAALVVPGWVNTALFLKTRRDTALAKGEQFDPSTVPFHEGKPAAGAWSPAQTVDFFFEELDNGRFYIMCPDNDVDRETDNLRMTWAMQDITQDRPPLSRWHPDYKEQFAAYLAANGK
mmetsp:Transcript_59811/g.159198  ORF Transcript_59811/g.159198 Transcript_59811/m.159198 type:complete len:308 (-) Transcript_59811:40-963(-)